MNERMNEWTNEWMNEWIKEWGFRPSLCKYRLNWTRRSSWVGWDEWDDTAFQTHYSKFEPWWSEVEHAITQSRRLPTILNLYERAGKIQYLYLKLECQSGVWTRVFPSRELQALCQGPRHRKIDEKQVSCKRPTAVTAYLESKQLLLFAIILQNMQSKDKQR